MLKRPVCASLSNRCFAQIPQSFISVIIAFQMVKYSLVDFLYTFMLKCVVMSSRFRCSVMTSENFSLLPIKTFSLTFIHSLFRNGWLDNVALTSFPL